MIAEAVAAADDPNAASVPEARPPLPPNRQAAATWARAPGSGRSLLTGVSYMIPFVAAGGLLIALGFLFGGYEIANKPEGATQSLGNIIATDQLTDRNLPSWTVSSTTWARCCSASAGWRSPSWCRHWPATSPTRSPTGPVSRPASSPARSPSSSARASSAASSAACSPASSALWIGHFNVPRWLRGLMPVVIIPLCATLIVGLLMFMVLGRPLAAITSGLTDWLNGLTGTLGDPAGRHPGPDDVLRPRWPGQQGGLRLRHRGAQPRRATASLRSWRP